MSNVSEPFVIWFIVEMLVAFLLFQPCAAIFAIKSLRVVPVAMAAGTAPGLQLLALLDHRGRDDASRHGDDGVADEHDDGGEEPADRCRRGDVAITDSGHRDDGPINAVGDIVESGSWRIALDHVHDGAHRDDENQDKQEENENFRGADPE